MDLTNDQWERIESLIPHLGAKEDHQHRRESFSMGYFGF